MHQGLKTAIQNDQVGEVNQLLGTLHTNDLNEEFCLAVSMGNLDIVKSFLGHNIKVQSDVIVSYCTKRTKINPEIFRLLIQKATDITPPIPVSSLGYSVSIVDFFNEPNQLTSSATPDRFTCLQHLSHEAVLRNLQPLIVEICTGKYPVAASITSRSMQEYIKDLHITSEIATDASNAINYLVEKSAITKEVGDQIKKLFSENKTLVAESHSSVASQSSSSSALENEFAQFRQEMRAKMAIMQQEMAGIKAENLRLSRAIAELQQNNKTTSNNSATATSNNSATFYHPRLSQLR